MPPAGRLRSPLAGQVLRFPDLPGPQSLPRQVRGSDDPADLACRHCASADDYRGMTLIKCLALAVVLLAGGMLLARFLPWPGRRRTCCSAIRNRLGRNFSRDYPGRPAYDVRSLRLRLRLFRRRPARHCSRHFGIYRMYTQWSRW